MIKHCLIPFPFKVCLNNWKKSISNLLLFWLQSFHPLNFLLLFKYYRSEKSYSKKPTTIIVPINILKVVQLSK